MFVCMLYGVMLMWSEDWRVAFHYFKVLSIGPLKGRGMVGLILWSVG